MSKLARFSKLLRLARKDPHLRQEMKAALSYLARFDDISPPNFSRWIKAWAKHLTLLQQYHARTPEPAPLPDDLSLIEDYPRIQKRIEEKIAGLQNAPLITIIVPISGADPAGLIAATLRSIRQQVYRQLEIYLLCDGVFQAELERIVTSVFNNSQPVMVKPFDNLRTNLAAALNEVVSECNGELVALVSSSDTITREAALEVASLHASIPDVDVFYSDEGKKAGEYFFSSFHKPGWSRDLFYSLNYTQNFFCARRAAMLEAGGFQGTYENDLKYDLGLRIVERAERVQHIPRVLYFEEALKTYPEGFNFDTSVALQKQALSAHLKRTGVEGEVSPGLIPGSHRIRRKIDAQSQVSIIIPTRDKIDFLRRCVTSIEEKSTFRNYEIIIVDNGSVETASAEYFAHTGHRVVRDDAPFNYSRVNNLGASLATGDHLLFLNNDIEVITPEWLEALLEQSQRAEVGAVGAKLLYPNGLIQHAGIVFGGPTGSTHADLFGETHNHGYHGLADVVRNFSAVTGACLMMRANVFREIRGFDEQLAVTYNDVDLCLKARDRGYLVVYTPYSVLYHHEGVSVLKKDESESVSIEINSHGQASIHRLQVPKGQARQVELFYARWKSFIENDVNYNPQMTACSD